ncbi:MAG: NHL repeat-containing protein [Candidatus Microsaccharimonas sp.]
MRKNEHQQAGFTIVELLIVVVVIAILAAIAIVSYNGIQKRATESTMKNDLQGNAVTLGIDNTRDGFYPASSAAANNGQGLKSSGSNTIVYEPRTYGYCMTVTNPKSGTTYRLKSIVGKVEEGDCQITVSTVAGTGGFGYVDGPGTSAQFISPAGIEVDTSGLMYVSEATHRIRKITPSAVVSTLAGSGSSGYNDATGTSAQFYSPLGITTDSAGTIYVADTYNNRIRKITPAGAVTTLAGSGTAGFADATGTSAQFNRPADIAVDASGTVYVADGNNYRIRKISPSGVVTTLAGSGTSGYADGNGTAAQFSALAGISVDSSGTIYVTDPNNRRIRKVTSNGVVSTLAGSGASGNNDGTGTAAQFTTPMGIAVDGFGTVYIADLGGNVIRAIAPNTVVTTLAGTGSSGFADGAAASAQFSLPYQVTVDGSTCTLYIADSVNSRIRKIEQ